MDRKNFTLRTALGRVKAKGAAGTGTSVFIAQRLTALALIPMVSWFVFMVLGIVASGGSYIYEITSSPFNTIILGLFIAFGMYHGAIGMHEIIEDYVHCRKLKFSLILLVNGFSLFTAVASICAILVLHFSLFKLG